MHIIRFNNLNYYCISYFQKHAQKEHQANSMMALCKEHYFSKKELNLKFCLLLTGSLQLLVDNKEKTILKEVLIKCKIL